LSKLISEKSREMESRPVEVSRVQRSKRKQGETVRRETEGKFGGMRKRMKQVLSWRQFVHQVNKKEAREG
jgi:hypothetical protein